MVDDLEANYALLKDCISTNAEEIEEEEITDAEGERNDKKPEAKNAEECTDYTEAENRILVYEAHCNVIFDLSVIAEIVTYKSSVVGVRICKIKNI